MSAEAGGGHRYPDSPEEAASMESLQHRHDIIAELADAIIDRQKSDARSVSPFELARYIIDKGWHRHDGPFIRNPAPDRAMADKPGGYLSIEALHAAIDTARRST
jgi:hypothetical protein